MLLRPVLSLESGGQLIHYLINSLAAPVCKWINESMR